MSGGRKLRRGWGLVAAAGLGLLLAAPAFVPRSEMSLEPAAFPSPGSVPPHVTLPVLTESAPWVSDETLTLTDFKGRWVYVDVFGSWCPPCRRKQPTMLKVAKELEEKGALVVGMLLKDRPEDAVGWLQANGGMAYPYLVLDAETERAWGITGAPMGFLISPEGRLEHVCYGCADGPAGVERLTDAVSRPWFRGR